MQFGQLNEATAETMSQQINYLSDRKFIGNNSDD